MRLLTTLTARHGSQRTRHKRTTSAAHADVKDAAILKPATAVKNKIKARSRHAIPSQAPPVPLEPRPPALWLKDLECVRKLGTGAYGSVLLVRVRAGAQDSIDRSDSLFALKVLQKTDIRNFDKHFSSDTDAERGSLCKLPWSPWVNGVVGAFQDPLNIYLMLECIPAGVLHDLIYRSGPLDATTARFYYANIVCALEFLHANGIVHRDLKPANILIKPDGYICLVDFGLAKPETDSHTWSMVGTPIYMAPELFMSQAGVGCGIDWFSSGVILYEMVTRRVPFYGKEEEQIYLRISSKKYKWPRDVYVGKSLKSMVAGLLTHEAIHRLGVAKPVRKHEWLSGIDWKRMKGQSYIAPWIPGHGNLSRMWQDRRLPPRANVPGIEVVEPAEYMKHDRRLQGRSNENEQG